MQMIGSVKSASPKTIRIEEKNGLKERKNRIEPKHVKLSGNYAELQKTDSK